MDERVVPLDDKKSNYKLAFDGFLSKVCCHFSIFCANKNNFGVNKIGLDSIWMVKKVEKVNFFQLCIGIH